jgi:hypothetical protein
MASMADTMSELVLVAETDSAAARRMRRLAGPAPDLNLLRRIRASANCIWRVIRGDSWRISHAGLAGVIACCRNQPSRRRDLRLTLKLTPSRR